MPESKADAKPTAELFEVVPSRTTGQETLKALLSEGKIQRIGKGMKGKPFRYFGGASSREKRLDKKRGEE